MNKKIWIPTIVVGSAILLFFAVIFPILWCVVWKIDLKVTAAQVGDKQEIAVNWEASKHVDSVEITVTHGDDVVSRQIITNQQAIEVGGGTVYAYYGRQKVTVKVKSGIYNTSKSTTVDVFTDEYNIAPITATMPVAIFTLNLDSITNNGAIPTFVWFKRSGAWDWSQLPENVHAMPVASSAKEFYSSNERKMFSKTTEWVKELHKINPDSKFNFYYNDYFAYGALDAVYASGLSQENYKIVFLSDGTASFIYFNNHFDNANYETEYNKMVAKYNKLKTQLASKKSYTANTRCEISAESLRDYAFVMANEEVNIEWWLTRASGTLGTYVVETISTPTTEDPNKTTDVTVYDKIVAPAIGTSIIVKDLKTSLMALDEAGKESLKKLYKFNDSMFEKAEEENKPALVVIGTWTQYEYEFDSYINILKAYYGDKFVYYYKGHPKNPTSAVAGKANKLEKLGLIDIDATIPAELIIFFNPSIYLTGYSSSTFLSAEDAEKCTFLFNVTKESAFAPTEATSSYANLMDGFLSKVTHSNAKYSSIVPNDHNTYYAVEFNDTTKYDVAIYNANKKTFKFYKLNGSTYEEVER